MQIQVGKLAVSTVVLSILALTVIVISTHFLFAELDMSSLRQEYAVRNLSFTVALIALLSLVLLVGNQFVAWKKVAKN